MIATVFLFINSCDAMIDMAKKENLNHRGEFAIENTKNLDISIIDTGHIMSI